MRLQHGRIIRHLNMASGDNLHDACKIDTAMPITLRDGEENPKNEQPERHETKNHGRKITIRNARDRKAFIINPLPRHDPITNEQVCAHLSTRRPQITICTLRMPDETFIGNNPHRISSRAGSHQSHSMARSGRRARQEIKIHSDGVERVANSRKCAHSRVSSGK